MNNDIIGGLKALKFTRNNWDEVKNFTNNAAHSLNTDGCYYTCIIQNNEETTVAHENDWIINYTDGKIYVSDSELFCAFYDIDVEYTSIISVLEPEGEELEDAKNRVSKVIIDRLIYERGTK